MNKNTFLKLGLSKQNDDFVDQKMIWKFQSFTVFCSGKVVNFVVCLYFDAIKLQ